MIPTLILIFISPNNPQIKVVNQSRLKTIRGPTVGFFEQICEVQSFKNPNDNKHKKYFVSQEVHS